MNGCMGNLGGERARGCGPFFPISFDDKNNKNCWEKWSKTFTETFICSHHSACLLYIFFLCSWSKDIHKSNKELEIIKVYMGPVCRVWQNWMRSCACNVILACRIVLPPAILCWLHEAVQISITYASTSGEGMLIHCSYSTFLFSVVFAIHILRCF